MSVGGKLLRFNSGVRKFFILGVVMNKCFGRGVGRLSARLCSKLFDVVTKIIYFVRDFKMFINIKDGGMLDLILLSF